MANASNFVLNPAKRLLLRSGVMTKLPWSFESEIPETYINLKVGLWNVSIDYIIATLPKSHSWEKLVLEIRSSFFKQVDVKSMSTHTRLGTLAHIDPEFVTRDTAKPYMYEKFTPLWFLIDDPRRTVNICIQAAEGTPSRRFPNLELEIGLLFQRIK
jgi:hypothetical protein